MARERETSRADTGKETMGAGKGGMTVSEAGRKGGETTSEKYGPEFYQNIGKKGGETVSREVAAGKEALGKSATSRGTGSESGSSRSSAK